MTPGKPLSFDRAEVLGKAMDLFWTNGYEATGVAELLEGMGIQRQSFYNTFGSKEQVFQEAVETYAAHMLEQVRAILDAPGNPIDNFHALFAFWEKMSESRPCCGCLIGNSMAEFGGSDEQKAAFIAGHLRKMEDLFHRTFQRAVDEGYLPADRDPRALARTLLATTQGLALLSKTGMEPEALHQTVETVKDLLFT